MTRKDYELIAAAFVEAFAEARRIEQDERFVKGMDWGITTAASLVANALVSTNPRFDKERFIAAATKAQS